eukprot:31783_1
MQIFLRPQPRIEKFLRKDSSLSVELRSNQLNNLIMDYYGIEFPAGIIRIMIEYENTDNVIHHQYQQYVAPILLQDHYPRKLLYTYKILNYTSSILAIGASFYHLSRWLNQATLSYTPSSHTNTQHNHSLPTFLTLFPIPGSLKTLLTSQYTFPSLYPSVYVTVPIFALWTSFEFMKNIIFFNTNRNISKLSYFMPVDRRTESITNALFNDWNELLYTDNYGLSPNRFVMSYTNDMRYVLEGYNRYIRVDENDQDSPQSIHFGEEPIVVPSPKYYNRSTRLPLPSYKHFLIQNNTLFTIIMLHHTLLPVSRILLKWNHLFLYNPNQKLQSITSHKSIFFPFNSHNTFAKLSNILLSHTYCLLHVVATSIIPVLCLRSVVFNNVSPRVQNVLNPMYINNNANAANAAMAPQDSDDEDADVDDRGGSRNAFQEFVDRWSLSNQLTSISLMLSMVPYVNNFYAMVSVFSFGMTLGEGEDIMRWGALRLSQNNRDNHKNISKINNVGYTYYTPWIAGVIGITCSFTIEVWASSHNMLMANKFKRLSLICLLLSICMSFGNRSYLETGFYLKYRHGRNIFEKMSQYAVEMELGIKQWIHNIRERNSLRHKRDAVRIPV